MRTKVKVKRVSSLTPEEYEKCRRLNFRDRGCMMYDLSDARKSKAKDAKVIMISDDSGRLISWSLVDKHHDSGYQAMFYTRVTERGKGYGKRLMRQVKKIDPNPHVYPHDERSIGFFKTYDKDVTRSWDSYKLK